MKNNLETIDRNESLLNDYLVDNEIKHFKNGFCVSANTIMSFWSYEVIF